MNETNTYQNWRAVTEADFVIKQSWAKRKSRTE